MTDPRHVAARTALLDALLRLDDHKDATVVIGAQAVYLRTGNPVPGIAPFTIDADLALDPESLAGRPIGDLLAGHFSQDPNGQPGIWFSTDEEIELDLLVPDSLAPRAGSRGALVPPHDARDARKARGLEPCLVDNDPLVIESLDATDERRVQASVAGSAALLIAKAFKISERLEHDRARRLNDKDAGDAYRLMLATPADELAARFERAEADARARDAVADGRRLLKQLFGASRSPGTSMAVRSFGGAVPAARIETVCTRFVATHLA